MLGCNRSRRTRARIENRCAVGIKRKPAAFCATGIHIDVEAKTKTGSFPVVFFQPETVQAALRRRATNNPPRAEISSRLAAGTGTAATVTRFWLRASFGLVFKPSR